MEWILASRNPGPRAGAPVASLRCRILRPGEVSINLLDSLAEKRFAEILIGGV
jgi:hypothetical protein